MNKKQAIFDKYYNDKTVKEFMIGIAFVDKELTKVIETKKPIIPQTFRQVDDMVNMLRKKLYLIETLLTQEQRDTIRRVLRDYDQMKQSKASNYKNILKLSSKQIKTTHFLFYN